MFEGQRPVGVQVESKIYLPLGKASLNTYRHFAIPVTLSKGDRRLEIMHGFHQPQIAQALYLF